jgi:hypothetical protein
MAIPLRCVGLAQLPGPLPALTDMKHFKAPWGTPLIIVSALATVLCLGITIFRWQAPTPAHFGKVSFWLGLLPAVLVIGCALFCIRGYTLTLDTLIIQRLFWKTRIPLADLQSAEFRPRAMRGSIRTFGNGGFFSVTGYHWSRVLGTYRAFVTDFRRTTILRFPTRTIVLSPDSPEDFVHELSSNVRTA